MLPTTVPTQFDPPALRASVQRLLAFVPECIYLTHYSRITEVPRAAASMLAMMDAMVAIAERHRATPDRHAMLEAELSALYGASLAEHGVEHASEKLALLAMDIDLNAQGLGVWLDRVAKQERRAMQ
jgi:hypothetical protein